TSENGSHTTFRYDVLDRLIQETGFDGRTQRYHHDLTGVHTTAANLDIRIPYATDPAGNRLPDPELHPDSTL
ncbi:hypothetical protein Q5442_26785, partial [Escherichia coli]|nr:hypothetical protein [Escherichia coli]MED8041184.1 hypothetical protein [Escherichia coli]MED8046267.1 hypothetical protein [Escherichia coli]MED8051439.1 hypothetical protein [Escherichia coli]MED8070625.1 hypothetical protein [Escherichia coli]